MLRRIGLKNFKCFEALDLPCAPLNLLCGLNSMGKSSVIQALLVLRQSFDTRDLLEGRLVLGGALTDLGAGSDVLFEDAEEEVVGFELRRDETPEPWAQAFGYSPTGDQLSVIGPAAEAGVPPVWRAFPPFGGRFHYVRAERVGPRKSYPLSEMLARRRDLGTSGEYAWNFLNDRQNDLLPADDPRCGDRPGHRLLDTVDYWLQDVSPGAHLQLESVRAADAVIAGFTFDRPGDVATRRHRATNVGFGLSYVLPVVLALLSPRGSLCLIENPEAHLHPRGQTRLAELAVRAATAGVQVFVETHSDHFVDGVRIAVRDELIAPADTAIHYFEREGARTVVSSPTVDTDGRLSRWPTGFFDQHDENLAKLLAPRSRPRSPDSIAAQDTVTTTPAAPSTGRLCPVTGQPVQGGRKFAGPGSDAKAKSVINALLRGDQRGANQKLAGMADPERLRAAAGKAREAGLKEIAKPSDWL